MSETKKENTEDEKEDIVDFSVAHTIAERDALLETLKEKDALIDELTKQLKKATDIIEEDSKAGLINEIAPKTYLDKKVLAVMDINELRKMKKTLDTARVVSFKSGTPKYEKDSPTAKLDNMFNDFADKTWRKN